MPPRTDITGKKFGKLTVTAFAFSRPRNRESMWNCSCDCGGNKLAWAKLLVNGTTKSCGCIKRDFSGVNHPQWRGGRRNRGAGYVGIYAPDHPYSDKHKVVAEHRMIMEKYLGRYLGPDETVHHKNGIRGDNRIENLELWCGKQPKGQRTEDLVTWAKEILARYEPSNEQTTKDNE